MPRNVCAPQQQRGISVAVQLHSGYACCRYAVRVLAARAFGGRTREPGFAGRSVDQMEDLCERRHCRRLQQVHRFASISTICLAERLRCCYVSFFSLHAPSSVQVLRSPVSPSFSRRRVWCCRLRALPPLPAQPRPNRSGSCAWLRTCTAKKECAAFSGQLPILSHLSRNTCL
jgi:hypothetical protein